MLIDFAVEAWYVVITRRGKVHIIEDDWSSWEDTLLRNITLEMTHYWAYEHARKKSIEYCLMHYYWYCCHTLSSAFYDDYFDSIFRFYIRIHRHAFITHTPMLYPFLLPRACFCFLFLFIIIIKDDYAGCCWRLFLCCWWCLLLCHNRYITEIFGEIFGIKIKINIIYY